MLRTLTKPAVERPGSRRVTALRLGFLLFGVLALALAALVLVSILAPVRRVTGLGVYSVAGGRPRVGPPPPQGLSGIDLAPTPWRLNRMRLGQWVVEWRWSTRW